MDLHSGFACDACCVSPGYQPFGLMSQPAHAPYGWRLGCAITRAACQLNNDAAHCAKLLHAFHVGLAACLRHGCGVAMATRGAPPRTRTRAVITTSAALCRHGGSEPTRQDEGDVPHCPLKPYAMHFIKSG